jgi:hypothetical protein
MGDHCRPNQRMRYGPSSSWERHDDRGDPSSDRLLSPFIFYRGSKRTSSRNSMVLILLAHPTGDARNPSKLLNQKGFSPTRFGPVYQSLVVHGSGAGTMEPLRNCSAKSVSDPNRTPQADPLDDRFAPHLGRRVQFCGCPKRDTLGDRAGSRGRARSRHWCSFFGWIAGRADRMPQVGGCHTGVLTKHTAEMPGIFETASVRDFSYLQVAVLQ